MIEGIKELKRQLKCYKKGLKYINKCYKMRYMPLKYPLDEKERLIRLIKLTEEKILKRKQEEVYNDFDIQGY